MEFLPSGEGADCEAELHPFAARVDVKFSVCLFAIRPGVNDAWKSKGIGATECSSGLRANRHRPVHGAIGNVPGLGLCASGGLTKARAIEEMKHAEGLIERIIFLDGIPAVNVALIPKLGTNPQTQLEIDLGDELDAIKEYNAAVKICAEAHDDGTRSLFEGMIEDEERHADFLEAQLHSIKEMGIQLYLSQQVRS